MSLESFENESVALSQGAGLQSARFVISKGASAVITGDIGPNALRALSAGGVDVAICRKGSVRDAVENYLEGTLKIIDRPSVDDHHGMVGQAVRNQNRRTIPET
jgi:predicted Fe-Mo cluster-binding NifX family protein